MIQTSQKIVKIRIPEDKKVAVVLSVIFSGSTIWTGPKGEVSQFSISRGEHDAFVCVPRVLEALKKRGIRGTFFIPGHTADTFPEVCREIIADGHEIGHHGYMLTELDSMTPEEEENAFQKALDSLQRLGVSPVGFRAPNEISAHTLDILEKYGFLYDSSLMGDDIHAYYPRPITLHTDTGCEYGEAKNLLEIPVSFHQDDHPYLDTMGSDYALPYFDCSPPQEFSDRCKDIFDYASRSEGCILNITIHTAATGNRPRMDAFEELLDSLAEKGACFMTCRELVDAAI